MAIMPSDQQLCEEKRKNYGESPYILIFYMICMLCTISLKMTIFMEFFFCLGCPKECHYNGGLKVELKNKGVCEDLSV